MNLLYFDEIIDRVLKLENKGIISLASNKKLNFKDLSNYKLFPDDFKYLLEILGFCSFSIGDSYLLLCIMIEELDQDDFDFLDSWSENPLLRKDKNKLFIARNVDSAFFAYNLDAKQIFLMEYCGHVNKYHNVFELIEREVVKPGEELLKLANQEIT